MAKEKEISPKDKMREMKNRLEGGFRHHKKRQQNRRRKINRLADDIHRNSQDYLDKLKKTIEENKKRDISPLSYLIEKSRYTDAINQMRTQATKDSPVPDLDTNLMTSTPVVRKSSLNAMNQGGIYNGVGNSTGCVACRRRLWDPI